MVGKVLTRTHKRTQNNIICTWNILMQYTYTYSSYNKLLFYLLIFLWNLNLRIKINGKNIFALYFPSPFGRQICSGRSSSSRRTTGNELFFSTFCSGCYAHKMSEQPISFTANVKSRSADVCVCVRASTCLIRFILRIWNPHHKICAV